MSDVSNEVAAEENEVLADEQAALEELTPEAAEEDSSTEYIEFLGTDPKHGTEFTAEHTVTRKQLWDAWDVTTPKDLRWTKLEGGPNKGRMLVPVADMSSEAAEGLANDPMFRRVTL